MIHTRAQKKRRLPWHAAWGAAIALAIAAAVEPPALAADAASMPNALERAQTAAQAFSSQLRGKLQAAMRDGGPEVAIEVCGTEAPAIAGQVMREHGVRLGRVALPGRNRNPDQVAQGWKLDALQAFQQAVENGAPAAQQVRVHQDGLPEGVALRMIRGIAIEPGCTVCHGTNIAPGVWEAIARRYPADAATGFEPGDLRGALWVEVPASDGTGS